jgi:hypothetical protein
MSNTGRKKKLASFNCDQELWARFMRRCQDKGTTATATLTRFIELYLDGSLDYLDAYPGNALDSRLDERVKACVNEYLEKRLPSYLDNYLATNHPTKKSRTNTNKKNSTPEREFWFIRERAKHLGLTINANQLIHIEMFANDAYQRRHGNQPKRQLFRKTQAFAYPVADVDLLDAAIQGIVARDNAPRL